MPQFHQTKKGATLLGFGSILVGAAILTLVFTVGMQTSSSDSSLSLQSQYDSANKKTPNDNIQMFDVSKLKDVFGYDGTNQTQLEAFFEKFDMDEDGTVSFTEVRCLRDPACGIAGASIPDQEKMNSCGCPALQGKFFPDQCSSPQWAGDQYTRIVKGGWPGNADGTGPAPADQPRGVNGHTGDILSTRITTLSFFYHAHAMGKLEMITQDCKASMSLDKQALNPNDERPPFVMKTYKHLTEVYGVSEEVYMTYCNWFAEPGNIPTDDECNFDGKSSPASNEVWPTKNKNDVVPNRHCMCINSWIQREFKKVCPDGVLTNNQCAFMQRSLCTLTIGQNPSHINDVQQQWNFVLPEEYMKITNTAGNRCIWMAYLKNTNPFGQCVDHPCSGLNNGDCTLDKTGGRCVWYNQGDMGCRGADGEIVKCESKGCYTSPCNNPSINSRAGCKAAYTYFDEDTQSTVENKYKCVWCNAKRASKDGLCPTLNNPKNGNQIALGGCGGCTNAGYSSQKESFGGKQPKCAKNADGTSACELKSEANCASIRACKGKKGLCMQKGRDKYGKRCMCSFTNPYCWLGHSEYTAVVDYNDEE